MSRSTETIQSRFTNGPLTIDFDAKSVLVNEQSVHLTPNEFQLLTILSHHVSKVLTYQVLLKSLYGYVNHTEMAALRVHMASLRKKLNYTQDPNTEKKLIITHPRIGYQMQHLE